MKKYILTISREFGCNAREISRNLAGRLGVDFYDRELIDMAAQLAGINRDLMPDSEEIIDVNGKKLFQRFGYGSTTSFYDEQAIQAQAQVIRDLANKKTSAVFFGRCSDYTLREYPNCLNIFLYAPLESRISHVSERYSLDRISAEKLIKRVDKQRHNYYKYVTGRNRGDRESKHIMLDVSRFGSEAVVEMIYDIVQKTFAD